jgi:cytochrome c
MPRARIAIALLVAAAAAVAGAAIAQEEPDELSPEDRRAMEAAEKDALDLGRKVFRDAALGTNDRSCATCHDNPKRPDMTLKGVTARFPRWDRQAGRVITLQEKFVQMQERSLKARKTLPLGDARWTALEMHLRGLK